MAKRKVEEVVVADEVVEEAAVEAEQVDAYGDSNTRVVLTATHGVEDPDPKP